MESINRLFLVCLIAKFACCSDSIAKTNNVGVVQVLTTHQAYEQLLPWQKRQPGTRSGYGVRVANDQILTTEALVRNATLVELRLPQSGKKIEAQVLETAPAANLAILKVSTPKALQNTVIHQVADRYNTTKPSTIAQFDDTRERQYGEATHIKTSLSMLPNGGGQALLHSLQTDLVLNGRGAPVLQDGKLAGIVSSYATATRSAELIAAQQLHDFVQAVKAGEFVGYATAGFSWATLNDPQKRRYLGAHSLEGGVLVLGTRPGSGAAASLRPQDIILSWDGFAIDDLGFYTDPDYGRLLMPYLIKGRRKPGDTIKVKLLRDRKPIDVSVVLANIDTVDTLIEENLTNERAEFVLEGGVLIRELTGAYLRAYGDSWSTRINARLVHLYYTQNKVQRDPGERIVIISRVIPDPINRGFEMFTNNIVTELNGKPVKNMTDVFAIRNADQQITRIKVQSVGVDLVLDPSTLEIANQRIAQRYRIPYLSYQIPTSTD